MKSKFIFKNKFSYIYIYMKMENSEYLTSITMEELNNMIKEISILQTYKKNQNKACRSYYERNKEKIKDKSQVGHKKIKQKT